MNFEPLIKTLIEEINIYTEIIDIEKNKTNAVVEGNIEELDKILNIEQMYGMKITNIEKKRISITDGLGLNGKTLIEIIKTAQNPDKTKLFKLHQKLVQNITIIKQLNEYNSKIINSRLGVITEINDLIYSDKPDPKKSKTSQKGTYTKDARIVNDRDDKFRVRKKI